MCVTSSTPAGWRTSTTSSCTNKRLPGSVKDIEEELLESSGAAVDKETGILTWKMELAPGETRKFRLSYSIRYPKDKSLYIHPS